MVTKQNTVLVTGGAGFIGGHLVELLIKKGYPVVVMDIQKKCASYFFINHLDTKVDYRIVDIRNKAKTKKLFHSIRPKYVIHLAAQPIVQEAYDHPYEAFETNIMGTVNILEACREIDCVERIIVASSDKAYGKTKSTYSENSPLQGDHPYDVSKSCEDLIAQTYYKTYGLPIVITRFGNVYGEGDLHIDRIVPGICEAIVKHKALDIRSDGTYVRDYLYVKDVADGYMHLLETKRQVVGEAYNFSSKDNLSVVELVKQAEKAMGVDIKYRILNTAKNEIPYQHLNDSKIKKIGWKNKYTLKKVLPNVLDWYKKHYGF